MSALRKLVLSALLLAEAVNLLNQLDQRQEIMFNPATDGPIRYEASVAPPRYSTATASTVVCSLTSAATSATGTTTCTAIPVSR